MKYVFPKIRILEETRFVKLSDLIAHVNFIIVWILNYFYNAIKFVSKIGKERMKTKLNGKRKKNLKNTLARCQLVWSVWKLFSKNYI